MKPFLVAAFLLSIIFPLHTHAGVIDDLKAKIEERNKKIKELEADIQKQQEAITTVQQEAQTLKGTIKELDITRSQLSTDINATQNKITRANLSIEALEIEINEKEKKMGRNAEAMAKSLRTLYQLDNESFLETLIASNELSDFWEEVANLQQFQSTIQDDLVALREARIDLAAAVGAKEAEKGNLVSYQDRLSDKKALVDNTKAQKDSLLRQTQNQEDAYKKILAEKLRQKEEFERELNDFEAQLQVAIDPNSFPSAGTSVFAWPLDSIRITQQFGGTEFAAQNPQVYGRPFHNGTDFGAPIGTELKAVLSGTVRATGNTDAIKGCYSYGKWILIDHPNGLSTLYGHLSLIRVSPGQKVSTGELIGYTGNTGFSTGPHLHLTTYVTKGVEVVRFGDVKKITNCGSAMIPVAPHNAYLDSMSYLPSL